MTAATCFGFYLSPKYKWLYSLHYGCVSVHYRTSDKGHALQPICGFLMPNSLIWDKDYIYDPRVHNTKKSRIVTYGLISIVKKLKRI